MTVTASSPQSEVTDVARAPDLHLTPERAARLRAIYLEECARRGVPPDDETAGGTR
jgi:hypothetical protein